MTLLAGCSATSELCPSISITRSDISAKLEALRSSSKLQTHHARVQHLQEKLCARRDKLLYSETGALVSLEAKASESFLAERPSQPQALLRHSDCPRQTSIMTRKPYSSTQGREPESSQLDAGQNTTSTCLDVQPSHSIHKPQNFCSTKDGEIVCFNSSHQHALESTQVKGQYPNHLDGNLLLPCFSRLLPSLLTESVEAQKVLDDPAKTFHGDDPLEEAFSAEEDVFVSLRQHRHRVAAKVSL